jgi:hypothetical protein
MTLPSSPRTSWPMRSKRLPALSRSNSVLLSGDSYAPFAGA